MLPSSQNSQSSSTGSERRSSSLRDIRKIAFSSAPTLDSTLRALAGTALTQSGVVPVLMMLSAHLLGSASICVMTGLGIAEVKAAWAAM